MSPETVDTFLKLCRSLFSVPLGSRTSRPINNFVIQAHDQCLYARIKTVHVFDRTHHSWFTKDVAETLES